MAKPALPERLAHIALRTRGIRSVRTRVDGMVCHGYFLKGEGTGPPLVLLHGLGAGAIPMARLSILLRGEARALFAPELPGHGFSDPPREGQLTSDAVLRWVEAAISSHFDEPVVLFGNSLGGAIALRYASRHPDRVAAVLACSPAGAPLSDASIAELQRLFRVESRAETIEFLDHLYGRRPWITGLFVGMVRRKLMRPWIQEFLAGIGNSDAITPGELARLTMPVHVIWGMQERLLPDECLEYWRRHLPDHAVVDRPEGFGHCPQIESPHALARVLCEILESLPD